MNLGRKLKLEGNVDVPLQTNIDTYIILSCFLLTVALHIEQ